MPFLGGLNPVHLIILLIIVILIFGPSRLTGAGKALGEAMREFKKSVNETPETEQKTEPEKLEA